MKFSSYAVISLFSIVLGLVSILPQISIHSVAASTPEVHPYAEITVADASVVSAAESADPIPEPVASTTASVPKKAASVAHRRPIVPSAPSIPVHLSIPVIGLASSVISVSTNERGEMDVPDGSTSDVGWYKDGVIPGQSGSAVMDAHVFAAFRNLNALSIGDELFVRTRAGSQLRFIVRDVKTYALTELSPDMLFEQTDGKHLNLITCAGSLTSDRSTYDHRLIVYAELAE